jgi:hypothetical protein
MDTQGILSLLDLSLARALNPRSQRPIPDMVKFQLIPQLDADHSGEGPDLHTGCK